MFRIQLQNMNLISRFSVSLLLVAVLLSNALPCGPAYVTPLFDTHAAPDNPYVDFAAGSLGIVKPTYRRAILFAAYRYIAGSGMSQAEQQAAIDVWNADLHNKEFMDNGVETAVKAWVEKRKAVVKDEESLPSIYVERPYGGYDFFPNCTRNAFETAAETLDARISSHSATDANVKNWVAAQDRVFSNCSSGKHEPEPAPLGAPVWLQKDRDYQIAAARFYSLDYADAKRRFAEIAMDTESPWQETADYLVARTLIRQASLSKTPEAAAPFYDEAESHLRRFVSGSGKFTASAEGLMALVKYRRHPEERVSELAQDLSSGRGDRFRQDLIDYTWLLDKFETQALSDLEKRKAAERERERAASGVSNAAANSNTIVNTSNAPLAGQEKGDQLEIYLTSTDFTQSWTLRVSADSSDEEAIAEAEKVIGSPLSDEMKKKVRDGRQSAYASRFSAAQRPAYEGGYYGDERFNPSLMPAFLRKDPLTEWLYVYQMMGPEAYLYSLRRYRESGSELWLMTALSKADAASTELPRLLEAAERSSRTSAAYTTIAYHAARILLITGRTTEARKLIDERLDFEDRLPISARNSFLGLRLGLAETLDDFIRASLKRPFAFDFDGYTGTIDDFIAEQKTWFDPESNKEGREAYDAEIEERFKQDKMWQQRAMFDTNTIDLLNQHFSTTALLEVMNSPSLPEYMKERFAIAIWTRAFLFDDMPTLLKVTPELAKYRPELSEQLAGITAAKAPQARSNAVLYFVIKNPVLSPYIEDGLGRSDNEFNEFDANDWWCEPYEETYDPEVGSMVTRRLPSRPKFMTAAQSAAAQNERRRLKAAGNAPKYLAEKVNAWARRSPADKRVPEAIYIMIAANGWTKYGCGNNYELSQELAEILRKRFPTSEWAAKSIADQAER